MDNNIRRSREETEEKILESSKRLFALNGYQATSLEDIAKDVKVSKALILKYFNSKKELVNSILADILVTQLESAFDPAKVTFREAVHMYAGYSYRFATSARCELAIIYQDLTLFQDMLYKIHESVIPGHGFIGVVLQPFYNSGDIQSSVDIHKVGDYFERVLWAQMLHNVVMFPSQKSVAKGDLALFCDMFVDSLIMDTTKYK